MQNRLPNRIALILFIAVAVCYLFSLWGSLLFSILFPFLIAYLLSFLIRPLAKRLSRLLPIGEKVCAVFFFFLSLALFCLLLFFVASSLLPQLRGLLSLLLSLTEGDDESIRPEVKNLLQGLLSSLEAALPSLASVMVSALPDALLSILVTLFAGFYFCTDRETIKEALFSCLPASERATLPSRVQKVKTYLKTYLRANLFLFLLTFCELLAGLLLLRARFAPLLSFLIALVDALPFFGAGAVLVPWAVVCLIRSEFPKAVLLLLLTLITSVTRQILEPRLIGKQLGLHPLLSITAGFIGWKIYGAVGMALSPAAALLVRSLWEGRK